MIRAILLARRTDSFDTSLDPQALHYLCGDVVGSGYNRKSAVKKQETRAMSYGRCVLV